MSGTKDFRTDNADAWEVQEETAPSFTSNQEAISTARKVQSAFSTHVATDTSVDWSEVVVELPQVARGRRTTVSFKRLIDGRPTALNSVQALDLSKSPDDILATVPIRHVIRASDASNSLLNCIDHSSLFMMSALEFIIDSESEAKFMTVPFLGLREYLEIIDLINAFTILVHCSATGSGSEVPSSDRYSQRLNSAQVSVSQTLAQKVNPHKTPADILARTLLAQIVLRRGSQALRQAMRRAECFKMSTQAFIELDNAEAVFCSVKGMNLKLYLELCELVNDFIASVFDQ